MDETIRATIVENCVKCGHFDPRREKAHDDLYDIVCGNCGFTMFVSGSNFVFRGKEVPLK